MKSLPISRWTAVSFLTGALLADVCARPESNPLVASPTTAPGQATPGPQRSVADNSSPRAPSAVFVFVSVALQWTDLAGYTFDARERLFSGLKVLEARVDEQQRELVAKRAAMAGNAYTKDWDFAMKEMEDARSYLKSMGAELRQATAETWAQKKEKVGQAWTRSQHAYAKVKSSVTY